MIGQTLAILLDAYRELNAKRLFWVTLILSGTFIGAFALVGVGPRGLSVLRWEFDVPMASFAYRWLFDFFIVGIWASWAAVIVALVSTAGIFPDLMSGGAIDLYLSKPIGRLRLFLTKYATGLLFVLLQTTVFATAAYLVMGLRAGEWRPAVFLIVPLVTCMFSYLFAVCVLLGVLTRSAIAALLLTVLVWAFFWIVAWGENRLLDATLAFQKAADVRERRRADVDAQLAKAQEQSPLQTMFGVTTTWNRARRDKLAVAAADTRRTAGTLKTVHRIFFHVASVVPKTSQTVSVLDRLLFTADEVEETTGGPPRDGGRLPFGEWGGDADVVDRAADADAIREATLEGRLALRNRPLSWVIGTSLAFEAAVLAVAAWVFCRRDY